MVRLYLRYIGLSLRAQLQFPGSLALLAAGQFLITGAEFLCMAILFQKFGSIRGWRLPEQGYRI